MKIIILNDASQAPVPAAQYERLIQLFAPIAQHGGGQMITPMGTMALDLSLGAGDAIMTFTFDGFPVALAAVTWEEYVSEETWEALLKGHVASLRAGESPNEELKAGPPAALPWLAISFLPEFFADAKAKNRQEATTVIWAMAMAIIHLKSLVAAHN